ncbi:hypothetical protein BDW66DRAFT_154275 [Aspergillus desertorum]
MTRTKVEAESSPSTTRYHQSRRRPRVSCEECRRRRVRCDRRLPCRPCRISRQRLTCRYRDNGADDDTSGPQSRRVGAAAHSKGLDYYDAQPGRETTSGAPAFASAPLVAREVAEPERHESLASNSQLPGSMPSHPRLLLCNSRHKTKLFLPGHWIYITDMFEWSRTALRDRELGILESTDDGDLAGIIDRCWDLHRLIKARRRLTDGGSWPDAVAALPGTFPSSLACSECVDAYMNTFHIVYPAFDAAGFLAEYEIRRGRLDSGPTFFLVKLGLVLVIGSSITRPLREINSLRQRAAACIDAAHSLLLQRPPTTLAKLDEIEIWCLLLLAHRVSGIPYPWSPGWPNDNLMGLARRAGLHLDPKHFANVGMLEAERRAGLWRAVLELIVGDGPTALILPDDDVAYCLPAREGIRATELLLCQSLRARMRVARLVHSRPTATQYSTVLQLAADLDRLCKDLRPVLQAEPRALTVLVEMQLRHAMLVLLQPFVLQGRTNAHFYLARRMCLQCAMALAAYAPDNHFSASVGAESSDSGSFLLQTQMTARGYLRGTFHPAVACALAMELIIQLSDETIVVGSGSPCALDMMARAQRAPIVKTLERLSNQLLEMMKLAFPTLKRYLLVSSILAQIHALETGNAVEGAVSSELYDGLKEAHAILKRLCN